jgi:hypothetical protein
MKLKQKATAISLAAIIALLSAYTAFASGQIAMPERRETLVSYKACLAHLNTSAAEHRAQVKPRTFKQDGGFQEVYLEDRSGGVKVTGRKAARYEARIWWHNGRLLEDGTQYEISHSWNGTNKECRGKVLIINNASGYTLSTFEPVQSKAP